MKISKGLVGEDPPPSASSKEISEFILSFEMAFGRLYQTSTVIRVINIQAWQGAFRESTNGVCVPVHVWSKNSKARGSKDSMMIIDVDSTRHV